MERKGEDDLEVSGSLPWPTAESCTTLYTGDYDVRRKPTHH